MKLILSSTIFLLAAERIHALDSSLLAGFLGTNQIDGNIFEIKTKTYPVSIKRMDIHMAAETQPIQVWYRPGKQSPVYVEIYENTFDDVVTGNGPNVVTLLPSFATPILIPANTTYTSYVTASKNGVLALYYEFGNLLGQAYASDDFLDINEGYQMCYSFSSPGFPQKWNGVVYYSTDAPPPAPGSPTKAPTPQPTSKSTVDTAPPVTLPPDTLLPTFANTLLMDTLNPTLSPTRKPVSGNIDTLSPTEQTPSPTVSTTTLSPISFNSVDTLEPTQLPQKTSQQVDLPSPTSPPSSQSPIARPTETPTTRQPTQSSSSQTKAFECVINFVSVVVAFLV